MRFAGGLNMESPWTGSQGLSDLVSERFGFRFLPIRSYPCHQEKARPFRQLLLLRDYRTERDPSGVAATSLLMSSLSEGWNYEQG